MQTLILYKFDTCPYCQLVMKSLKKDNITIQMKDIIENPTARQELIKIGGKAQVPCLVINKQALYESNHIINWLKENYKKG